MPSFPRSGCLIKLGSEKQGDKVLQVVPPKAGSWPDEVTHQDDEKALLADLCIWYVNKVEDGGVDLVPYHYPDLRLAITDGKVVLDEGQGRNSIWCPEYASNGQWTFTNAAFDSRLQHLQGFNLANSNIGCTKAKSARDSDKWTIVVVVPCKAGAELWNPEAQLQAVKPSDKRKVKLSKKWQRLYVENWDTGLKKAPFTVKVVGQRAGIGKSALVNHLAQGDVSEVLHGSVGSVGPVECTINCGGLDWKVVDIPGCNGLHLHKKLLSREARSALSGDHFIKQYHLEKPAHTDVILYVASMCPASKRGVHEQEQEQKLARRLYNSAGCIPFLIVNTSASLPLTPECRFETMRRLGLSMDQAQHVHMFNVNVPWAELGDMPSKTIDAQRETLDFPSLLAALAPPGPENAWCLYTQIQTAHLARTQVDKALSHLSHPGALQYVWVLSTHTVLGLFAPFYGPVLEAIARISTLILAMFEAVGLVDLGVAERFRKGADKRISLLEEDQPLLEAKEAELKVKAAAAKEKSDRVRGGSKHVGHNAGETGLVAAVEIGAKEAMYPAFEAAKLGLSAKLAEGVLEQAVSTALEAALSGALPFVGALVSAAFMRHAYHQVCKWVAIVAYQRHEDWLLAHWHQLSRKPGPDGSSLFPAGSSKEQPSRCDELSRRSSPATSTSLIKAASQPSAAPLGRDPSQTNLLVTPPHAAGCQMGSCPEPQLGAARPVETVQECLSLAEPQARSLSRAGCQAELVSAVSAVSLADSGSSSGGSSADLQLEAEGSAGLRYQSLSRAGGLAELISAASAVSSADSMGSSAGSRAELQQEPGFHNKPLRRAGSPAELFSAASAVSLASSSRSSASSSEDLQLLDESHVDPRPHALYRPGGRAELLAAVNAFTTAV